MWGARERIAFRKIFPALRIFSEGTWISIRRKEGKRKKESLRGKTNQVNPYITFQSDSGLKNTTYSYIYIFHMCNCFVLRTKAHCVFIVSGECAWGCLVWCSAMRTTSGGYWWLINPLTSHYLGNGVSRTERNVRFNERCLKNKTSQQKEIKQKVH